MKKLTTDTHLEENIETPITLKDYLKAVRGSEDNNLAFIEERLNDLRLTFWSRNKSRQRFNDFRRLENFLGT